MDRVEEVEIVRIVNSVFESNTYLIMNSNYRICFLIDCGDSDPIIDNINRRNLSLKGVFITHSHFDHIYGLNSVVEESGNFYLHLIFWKSRFILR